MFLGNFSKKGLFKHLEQRILGISAKDFWTAQITTKIVNEYIFAYGRKRIANYVLRKRMFPIIENQLNMIGLGPYEGMKLEAKETRKELYTIYKEVNFQGSFEDFEKDFLGFCFDHVDKMFRVDFEFNEYNFMGRYGKWVDHLGFPQGDDRATQFWDIYLKLNRKLKLEDTDYLMTKVELELFKKNNLNDSTLPIAEEIEPFYLNLLEMEELAWEKVLPHIAKKIYFRDMLDDFVPFDFWYQHGKSFYEIVADGFQKLKNNKRFLFRFEQKLSVKKKIILSAIHNHIPAPYNEKILRQLKMPIPFPDDNAWQIEEEIIPLTEIPPKEAEEGELVKIELEEPSPPEKNSASIKSVGYLGEKVVFEKLSETFNDVIWLNKTGEVYQAYDLIFTDNGETFYVEVKSSINDIQSFNISKQELDFAKDHSEHYILYHIINVGTENMAYREFTHFYKKYEDGYFKHISTVLQFE